MKTRSERRWVEAALLAAAAIPVLASGTVLATAPKNHICHASAIPASGVRGNSLVSAADGSLWLTDFNSNGLIRVDSKRDATPIVPVDRATRPLAGLAIDKAGSIWYSKLADRIGRIPPNGGEGVEFELPKASSPAALPFGPDGNLWFVSRSKHFLSRFSPAGRLTAFDGPKMGGSPLGGICIAVGPDNALWINSHGHSAVYRFDPVSQQFRRFDVASPKARPTATAFGPDRNLWVSLRAARKVMRLTTSGAMTEFSLGNDPPVGLSAGPDSSVWVSRSGGGVMQIDPSSGAMRRHSCLSSPSALTTDGQGSLWVLGNGQIAMVRERENAVKARVAAVASVAAPTVAGGNPLGATVEIVSADLLADRIQNSREPVIVQFSSPDEDCTFCIPGNSHYDRLAESLPNNTKCCACISIHGTRSRAA
jgi:virginiamycin B lyase